MQNIRKDSEIANKPEIMNRFEHIHLPICIAILCYNNFRLKGKRKLNVKNARKRISKEYLNAGVDPLWLVK